MLTRNKADRFRNELEHFKRRAKELKAKKSLTKKEWAELVDILDNTIPFYSKKYAQELEKQGLPNA